ncbi:MAG: signal peptidase II [Acidimicrobiia bacterium]|nr:signal peptidase II [Acidimicrobiia bacterium]
MENGAAEAAAGLAAVDPRPTGRRAALILAAVALIVAVDQATKAWAVASLSDGPIGLIGEGVELRLSRNPGGAFSTFRGATPVLAVIAAGASVFLWRTAHRATDRWVLTGLVLVLSGALGNLVDRVARSPGFLRGHVVDFVSVGWWPVFNVADSAITLGAIALVIRTWRAQPDPAPDSGG